MLSVRTTITSVGNARTFATAEKVAGVESVKYFDDDVRPGSEIKWHELDPDLEKLTQVDGEPLAHQYRFDGDAFYFSGDDERRMVAITYCYVSDR